MKDLDLRVYSLSVFAVLFAVYERIDHKQSADQYARNNTCKEQITDRCAGCHSKHNERNAGRDDNAKAACNGYDRCGKDLVIAHVDQKRNGHTSDRGNSSRRGSGNRSVKQAGNNDRAGNTGSPLAKEVGKHVKETFGDLSARHQDAGKDKHRNGQQREAVDTAYHRADNITCACRKGRVKSTREYCNQSQCDGNRHRDQKEQCE